MKTLYLIVQIVIILFAFIACDNQIDKIDDSTDNSDQSFTITFENFELGNASVWDGSDMSGGFLLDSVWFTNDYISDYGGYSNGGFCVSNQTDTITAGFSNQYSVFNTGGSNGSEKFAVVYYSSYAPENSRFTFEKRPSRVKSLKVNNSTYVYLTIKNGDDFTTALGANDWFKVVFEGYFEAKSTGKVEFYLADFRNGLNYICKDWTNVNLTALGIVDEVRIFVEGSDVGEYGLNTPSYVCIDDIEIEY